MTTVKPAAKTTSKAVTRPKTPKVTKAYKGFEDATDTRGVVKGECRGHEYRLGQVYSIPVDRDIVACECGFHACVNPKNVQEYYGFEGGFIYGEVEIWGDLDHKSDKVAARNIKVTRFMTEEEFKQIALTPVVNKKAKRFMVDLGDFEDSDKVINKVTGAVIYSTYDDCFDDVDAVSEAPDAVLVGDFRTYTGKLGCMFIEPRHGYLAKVDGVKVKEDTKYRFSPNGKLVLAKAS